MEASRTRTSHRREYVSKSPLLTVILHIRSVWGLTQANNVDAKVVLALRRATTTLGLPTICSGRVHCERILIKERIRSEAGVK